MDIGAKRDAPRREILLSELWPQLKPRGRLAPRVHVHVVVADEVLKLPWHLARAGDIFATRHIVQAWGTILADLDWRYTFGHGYSFLVPRYVDSAIRGSGRDEEPSGGDGLRLIQIRLTMPSLEEIAPTRQDNSPQARIAEVAVSHAHKHAGEFKSFSRLN